MNDPMGDMGGPTTTGGDPTTTTTGSETITGSSLLKYNEIVDPIIIQCNLSRIERIRSVMGITSGCIAGILGFTGMQGFVCFIVLHLLVSYIIWIYKMECNLRIYTQLSWFKYLIKIPIQPTALSFTLFWTLFYGLVFLY